MKLSRVTRVIIFSFLLVFLVPAVSAVAAGTKAEGPMDADGEDPGASPKKGESPRYLKTQNTFPDETRNLNLRVAPAGLLLAQLGATLDIGLSPRVTLGPEIEVFNSWYNGYNAAAYALGPRLNFKLSGLKFTDGWYLGTSLLYYSINISNYGPFALGASTSGVLLSLLGGYQWLWHSGFNINLGMGLEAASFSHVHVTDNSGDSGDVAVPTWGTGVLVEFTFGWLL